VRSRSAHNAVTRLGDNVRSHGAALRSIRLLRRLTDRRDRSDASIRQTDSEYDCVVLHVTTLARGSRGVRDHLCHFATRAGEKHELYADSEQLRERPGRIRLEVGFEGSCLSGVAKSFQGLLFDLSNSFSSNP
jgi:hypothetical protein